jgi:organic radical activating enzyme|tara:strand:+ start:1919 stop:2623 length:705 start_codon:yes stop_codon:yes gene_type:complete
MNEQKPERLRPTSPTLDVHSIFPTIQGEGPFVGQPCVFVRLAGCNLQCPFCDTAYTEGRAEMTVETIIFDVAEASIIPTMSKDRPLVVITGGEPFRQDLEELVVGLTHIGYDVQIETNGTLAATLVTMSLATIVCSPKTPKLNKELVPYVDAFKYVIEAGKVDPATGLPLHVLGATYGVGVPTEELAAGVKVYVQAMDSYDEKRNAANLAATLKSVMTFGHTLCLQTQKIINVD